MSKELEKAYEPARYEDGIYAAEEQSGFFNPDNVEGEPYAIMMPPPNVTARHARRSRRDGAGSNFRVSLRVILNERSSGSPTT